MLARFCGGQRKLSRLRQKTTTAIACRIGICVATQAGGLWMVGFDVWKRTKSREAGM